MSKFERLLVADSAVLPDCHCGSEMQFVRVAPVPGGGSEVRIFRCTDCDHELRLTVWLNDPFAA